MRFEGGVVKIWLSFIRMETAKFSKGGKASDVPVNVENNAGIPEAKKLYCDKAVPRNQSRPACSQTGSAARIE